MITGSTVRVYKTGLPFYYLINRKLFNKKIYAYVCKNCILRKKKLKKFVLLSLQEYVDY